jgi:maltose O-acetyltransferase
MLLNTLYNVKIGNNTKIVGPIYFGNSVLIEIGNDNWIGRDFKIDGNGKVIIGNRNDFAPEIMIPTGSHEIGSIRRRAGKRKDVTIVIGDGNWFETRSTLIEKNIIGNGNIIGAATRTR